MSSVSNNGILINIGSNSDCIFPYGHRDIDNKIVNFLVPCGGSGRLLECNLALFNLSQVNQCASKCLGNPFFKGLFGLQHPFLAEKNFEFPLFSRCYPNVYWKVLCDVFPTINIMAHTTYVDGYYEIIEDEDDFGCCNRCDEPTPESPFKFKLSFLEMGVPTIQSDFKAEERELEKKLRELCGSFDGDPESSIQKARETIKKTQEICKIEKDSWREISTIGTLIVDKSKLDMLIFEMSGCKSRLGQLNNLLSKEGLKLCCREFNSTLFSELGRGKLQEEIFFSLSLLRQCNGIVSEINNNHVVITTEQKNQVLTLFSSCHWMIRWEVVGELASIDDIGIVSDEDRDIWFEQNFLNDPLKLQEAISVVIRGEEQPKKIFLRSPKVPFDAI